MSLHGSSENGGLSTGGGPHSANDDLITGRPTQIDPNGGSRMRDDPGYGTSDPAYPPEGKPNEVTDAGTKVNQEDPDNSESMPTYEPGTHVNSAGGHYVEPNELKEGGSGGYPYKSDEDVTRQMTGKISI